MKNWFIILFTLLLIGCQNTERPLFDQTSTVLGQVTSEEGDEIDSCIIGFITSNVDPELIQNDSILLQSVEIGVISNSGRYRIDWFLGPVPLPYNRMYAFKKGYELWHFKSGKDRIINVKSYIDSLDIVLMKRSYF